MPMRAFFLSDIHLRSGADEASLRFARFLNAIPQSGDLLLLGGDIFDLFVGHKSVFLRKHAGVIEALRAAESRGVEIHYLEGNHDFHVERVFSGPRTKVHADDYELEFGGRKILLSHGDMIDPEDKGYRFLRWITRTSPFRFFLWTMPGAWIDSIGAASSKESRKYNHEEAGGAAGRARLRSLYRDFAEAKIGEGFQHVLVGHSHLRDQIDLQKGEKAGEYVNLGFSSQALPYGVLEPGAKSFKLVEFT